MQSNYGAQGRKRGEKRTEKQFKRAGHEKLKTSRKPKRHTSGALKSTNQNMSRGHDTYGTATTH